MTYVARVCMGDADTGSVYAITGRGATPEGAKRDCLRQVSVEILIELAEGVLIPEYELDKIPEVTPFGCGLVIFVRTSHNHGDAYSYRYFAIPNGNFTVDKRKIVVTNGRRPTLVSTMDSNSEVTYPLPKGSLEYVDRYWKPSTGVRYNY